MKQQESIKKPETFEELNDLRKSIDDQYDSRIPEYLDKYLDNIEEALGYKERAIKRYKKLDKIRDESTPESRKEYAINRRKEFWKEAKLALKKKKKRTGNPVYTESRRNPEIVAEERELTQEEKAALITVCEKDIYLFAIRYFSHYLKKPSSPLHRYLYMFLNRNLNNKKRRRGFKHAVAAPRSYAKSTLISAILPLWCIAYNKKRFIIIVSDTAGQAEDFLTDIKRELEFNELLKRDFPYLATKGPVWRANEIITKNDVKVLALGTGSKVRGRRFGVDRPGLIIVDDAESSDMIRSPATRDFIRYEWFNKDLLYVGGEEGAPCDFLVVGTILGKDSLLNALLDPEEYPDWTSRRFQAVKKFSVSSLWEEWGNIYKDKFNKDRVEDAKNFFTEHRDEMLEGTEVLWPEGETYYDLMIYKLSNPSGFVSEKQNDPIDINKILVSKDQLKFRNFDSNRQVLEILESPASRWYGFIDPSLGKYANKGDFSCITTLCQDRKSGILLVVDFDMKRRKVTNQIEAILRNHLRYNYNLFGVETNAFQLVIADSLRKKARAENIYIPIKEVIQKKDKKMRIEGIIPLILDGTLIFDKKRYSSNMQYHDAIEQIVTYTGENDRHDDAPDSLASCVDIAKQKRFKLITKRTR